MEKLIGGKSHPRLLLADDHEIFSDALRVYLEKDFDIVGVVSDGRTLVDEAIRIKPDVIIADVGMPLLNGLDAARRIKELAPKIKFIFLTMQDDANLAAAALELGPVAFVLKHSAGAELREAINEVPELTTMYHGLPDQFCASYGTVHDIRKMIGLDPHGIREGVLSALSVDRPPMATT